MYQRFTILFGAATILAAMACTRPARAQAPESSRERRPQSRPGRFPAEEFPASAVPDSGPVGITRDRLEKRLSWEVRRLVQNYALTPDQARKLEVAGRGDIKRFFGRVREKEAVVDRIREELMRSGERESEKLLAATEEMRVLMEDVPRKLFIEGSIFAKTLRSTLSVGQRRKYEQDRLDFYRSRVEWLVGGGLEVLHLSADQRRRLVELIVQQTPPLRRYGSYDFQAVMIQVSRLPQGALRPIFDDAQWRRLVAGFESVKRDQGGVVAGGYLSEEADRPAGGAVRGLRQQDG